MKTRIIIIAVLSLMAAACVAPKVVSTEKFVQAVNKPQVYYYSYSQSGTLTITKSMLIAGVLCTVPAHATDTVKYTAGTGKIGTKNTGTGRIYPGASKGWGYNDLQRIDSLIFTIPAHSMPTFDITTVK